MEALDSVRYSPAIELLRRDEMKKMNRKYGNSRSPKTKNVVADLMMCGYARLLNKRDPVFCDIPESMLPPKGPLGSELNQDINDTIYKIEGLSGVWYQCDPAEASTVTNLRLREDGIVEFKRAGTLACFTFGEGRGVTMTMR
jgi:hypothetical protein